jgi:hypothetical protein
VLFHAFIRQAKWPLGGIGAQKDMAFWYAHDFKLKEFRKEQVQGGAFFEVPLSKGSFSRINAIILTPSLQSQQTEKNNAQERRQISQFFTLNSIPTLQRTIT